MPAILSCMMPQTVALKCPAHIVLLSRKETWLISFAVEVLHIRDYQNTNDSNFILHGGPDSSPKGPAHVPQLIYSAE